MNVLTLLTVVGVEMEDVSQELLKEVTVLEIVLIIGSSMMLLNVLEILTLENSLTLPLKLLT